MLFTRLQARNYRVLKRVDQDLDRFQALVGPNASGKTSFLEIFVLLKDLIELRGDVQGAVARRSTDFSKLTWKGLGSCFDIALEAKIPNEVLAKIDVKRQKYTHIRYEIRFAYDQESNEVGLDHEVLWIFSGQPKSEKIYTLFPTSYEDDESIFWTKKSGRIYMIHKIPGKHDNYYPETISYKPVYRLGRIRSALANVPPDQANFSIALWFQNQLGDSVQNFILNSQEIRQPSPPGKGNRFLPDGSNLPWVVNELRKNPRSFKSWLEHIQTALDDIDDVQTVERPEDRHRYLVIHYKNGSVVPSWLVSDGTLRLLALTIPAYSRDTRGTFLIEEPENGIHPKAMETVTQSLTSIYQGQVFIATHSPIVINQLEASQIVCFAKNDEGATDTVSGDRHPRLRDWKSNRPDLGTLAASGILS